METLLYFRTPSPFGPLFLAASTTGLVRLEFEARMQKVNPHTTQLHESKSALAPYLRELNEYFAGKRREFSFPLDLRGTEFQLACWHALLEIPYGETRSYRDIAQAIGHAHAYRAVGMSNNRNPVAIVVPCHRVIASSGSLCGYGRVLVASKETGQAPSLRVDVRRDSCTLAAIHRERPRLIHDFHRAQGQPFLL